ncbi:dUTP diphosphatase [Bacillus infantis]|uniref:dUTP diphosphatase n=1 Tax=Bacillus infantis TaxID=324767 RepID=UPI003981965E
MNLKKLFEVQKVLKDRIGYNEPDRFDKLVLALLVELGECANEWRGFKFWSKDQEPRVKVPATGWGEPYKNLLLEEYVDGLHFILELGIDLRAKDPWQPSYEENITEQFRTLYFHISLIDFVSGHDHYEYTVSYYLGLGEMLGFTWEQIEQAYMDKNAVNHERQNNGY